MAVVRLTRVESETGKLPNVCMRCGAPATVMTKKNFSWQPPWIAITILGGLLPYIIIALILQKKMRLLAPMCPQHQNHWQRQVTYNLIAAAGFALVVGSIFAIPSYVGAGVRADDVQNLACFGAFALLLVWLIVNVIFNYILIHPIEITDRDMQLKGVHESFKDALARWRVGESDDEAREALPEALPAEDRGQFYDPNARKPRPREE
jgi:hypothetical protein